MKESILARPIEGKETGRKNREAIFGPALILLMLILLLFF